MRTQEEKDKVTKFIFKTLHLIKITLDIIAKCIGYAIIIYLYLLYFM
jgi:hypothetical protein